MARYRDNLPQMSGDLFLMDAGLETDIIFNRGVDIPEFAAHTLLTNPKGRDTLETYFREFLTLAGTSNAGLILDTTTWKAHKHWAKDLGATEDELKAANHASVSFISGLRDEFSSNTKPIVLNALFGPCGDAYAPERLITAGEAEEYHAVQMSWLSQTEIDMVTALTFTQSDEAIGVVRAARGVGLPIAVSFTVETNGCLPTGQPLGEAIMAVDEQTDQAAAYFMVNCAHPDHFMHLLEDCNWSRRIRGLRCNASRLSHAELDECEVLDDGDPAELGRQHLEMKERLPWLNIFGGCCGSDIRHVTQIVKALTA